MARFWVMKWDTKKRLIKILKVVWKIVFYGVAFVGWFLFGFFVATIIELFKFLER